MEVKVTFDLNEEEDKELHEKFFKQVHGQEEETEDGEEPDYLTALQDFDTYLEEGEDDPKAGKVFIRVRKKFKELLTDNNIDLNALY